MLVIIANLIQISSKPSQQLFFYKVAVLQNFPGLLRSIFKFLLIEQTTYPPGSSTDQDMHIMGNQDASWHPVLSRPPPPSPSLPPFLTSARNQSASELECCPHRPGVGKQNRAERNALGKGWVVTLVFSENGAETIFRLHLRKVIWRVICVLF